MLQTDTTTVQVEYYAILREQRGCSRERVVTSAKTAADLYDELQTKHGFSLPAPALRVAINGEFQPWTTELRTEDVVVFLPPVAGG